MKKKIIQFVTSLLLVIISSPLSALEVADINKAIRDQGANWVAGETSMSKLSPEEIRRRLPPYGGELFKAAARQPRSSRQAAAADLPARFDWRNVGGHSYVTSVKDQGECAACYAFAATAALESRVLIASRTPDTELNLSEQTMISCDERQYGGGGGFLDYAGEFLQTTGLPLESCYPFTSGGDGIAGACGGCDDWQQNTYRITAFENVSTSVEAMKSAIVKHGPLFVGMVIFQDFLSYKSGIYSHVTGSVVSGHSVVLVGYDDAEQYWIAKNSMGSDWGENGFFRIKAGTNECNIESEAYDLIYATVPGASFVLTPASADFGTLTLPDQPSKTLPFTIRNNGSVPLTNFLFTLTNQHYSVSPPGVSVLESAASVDFQVTYTAHEGKTPDTGELQVVSGGVTRSSQLTAQTNTSNAAPDEGGCFIATAAFGTPMTGQVQILRQFRDRYLLTNKPGQNLVAWYYRNGPIAADYIKGKPLTRAAIRLALYPLIGLSFLLISGYLPFMAVGFLLTTFLFFRLRPKKSNAISRFHSDRRRAKNLDGR